MTTVRMCDSFLRVFTRENNKPTIICINEPALTVWQQLYSVLECMQSSQWLHTKLVNTNLCVVHLKHQSCSISIAECTKWLSTLATPVSEEMWPLRSTGLGFETTHDHMKQFAHNWHFPCHSRASSIQRILSIRQRQILASQCWKFPLAVSGCVLLRLIGSNPF